MTTDERQSPAPDADNSALVDSIDDILDSFYLEELTLEETSDDQETSNSDSSLRTQSDEDSDGELYSLYEDNELESESEHEQVIIIRSHSKDDSDDYTLATPTEFRQRPHDKRHCPPSLDEPDEIKLMTWEEVERDLSSTQEGSKPES